MGNNEAFVMTRRDFMAGAGAARGRRAVRLACAGRSNGRSAHSGK